MFSFVQEAGAIAVRHFHERRSELKMDSSVITESDREISRLMHERLSPFLAGGEHLLVDEEDPRRGDNLNASVLNRHPYLWSIDPIDGTRAYANGFRHYGISVGLLRELKPWLGAVYFPSMNELFYCDGRDAYFVEDAFGPNERKTKILPIDETITSRSIFIASDEVLTRFRWEERECRAMVLSTAVCEFCWPAIGRGLGSLSRVHLWDLAGSWPIFEKAGLRMRRFEDGAVLDRVEPDLFVTEKTPWKLKNYYILSSEKNFEELKSRLHPSAD